MAGIGVAVAVVELDIGIAVVEVKLGTEEVELGTNMAVVVGELDR